MSVGALWKILIWAIVIGVIFGFLWWRGYLRRFGQFLDETREELWKCSWPTKEELKGATAVVLVTIVLLGLYIGIVDVVVLFILRILLTAAKGG